MRAWRSFARRGSVSKKYRLGYLRSRVCDLAFWLLEHRPPATFDWDVAAPSWFSSFVPNLEAEFGLALMFASMTPIYWRAGQKRR
jgi:hypothetical protein